MDAYGVAFARQDADAAAALFTDDATYEWGPFGELLRGPDEIRARWTEAADASAATFDYEVIAVTFAASSASGGTFGKRSCRGPSSAGPPTGYFVNEQKRLPSTPPFGSAVIDR